MLENRYEENDRILRYNRDGKFSLARVGKVKADIKEIVGRELDIPHLTTDVAVHKGEIYFINSKVIHCLKPPYKSLKSIQLPDDQPWSLDLDEISQMI